MTEKPTARRRWLQRSGGAVFVIALVNYAATRLQEPRLDIDYDGPVASWPYYGGDAGGTRYSPLTQITPANVKYLTVAWTYRSGMYRTEAGILRGALFKRRPSFFVAACI